MPPAPTNKSTRRSSAANAPLPPRDSRKRSASPSGLHQGSPSKAPRGSTAATLTAAPLAAVKAGVSASSSSPSTSTSIDEEIVAAGPPSREKRSLRPEDVYYEREYRDEILSYINSLDQSTLASAEFMDMQPELQWYMRPYLVDFLIEVHTQFRLRPEVLYLAMNIVDRYVSKRVVYKKHYQLVGCAALWIASKFEDGKDKVPLVKELTDMCCKAYDESAFIQMEGHVLSTIGWLIGHPTAESWLRYYTLDAAAEEAPVVQNTARFLMETTLYHREFVGIQSSIIAAGALTLARHISGKPRKHFGVHDTVAIRVAFAIDKHFCDNLETVSEIAVKKFSHKHYGHISKSVLAWYESGRRFIYTPDPVTPISTNSFGGLAPASWSSSWNSSSPASTTISASSSEAGDEPLTPITPVPAHSHQVVHPSASTSSEIGYFVPSAPSTAPGGNNASHSKENVAPPTYSSTNRATYVETLGKQVSSQESAMYGHQRPILHPIDGTERSELPLPVQGVRMMRRSSS